MSLKFTLIPINTEIFWLGTIHQISIRGGRLVPRFFFSVSNFENQGPFPFSVPPVLVYPQKYQKALGV